MSGLHTRWKSMSAKELRKECRSLLRGHGLMQVTLYAELKKLEGRISKQRKEIVRLESIRDKSEPAIEPEYRDIDLPEALGHLNDGKIVMCKADGKSPWGNVRSMAPPYENNFLSEFDSCWQTFNPKMTKLMNYKWRVKAGEPS